MHSSTSPRAPLPPACRSPRPHRPHLGRLAGCAAAASVCAAGAVAQPLPRADRVQVWELRPVNQGVGDVSGLSLDQRVQARVTRLPDDFSGVFEIPRGSGTRYDGWYARVAGGTYAVFPRSEYSTLRDGRTLARVPANTVFFIGGIPKDLEGRGPVNVPTGRVPGALAVDEPALAPPPARFNAVDASAGSPMVAERVDAGVVVSAAEPTPSTRVEPVPSRPAGQSAESPQGAVTAAARRAAEVAEARRTGQRLMDDEPYRGQRVDNLLRRAAGPAGPAKR